MDYKLHYELLIERAKERKLDCYTESHHIIPRCMNGSDDKDNLVNLTAREHFVAHILLVKIYPEYKGLINAVDIMCKGQDERKIHNRMYGWLKERFSKRMSEINKGEKNSQFGKIWISNLSTMKNKKIRKDELEEYINKGWLKGRNIWNKDMLSKEEKAKKRKQETIERNKKKKELKKIEIEEKKLEKIRKYREDYFLFREIGFEKFKEITGYTKSYENLVMSFKRNVIEYESKDHKAVKKRRINGE